MQTPAPAQGQVMPMVNMGPRRKRASRHYILEISHPSSFAQPKRAPTTGVVLVTRACHTTRCGLILPVCWLRKASRQATYLQHMQLHCTLCLNPGYPHARCKHSQVCTVRARAGVKANQRHPWRWHASISACCTPQVHMWGYSTTVVPVSTRTDYKEFHSATGISVA